MERKAKLGLIFFFVLLAAALLFFLILQPGMQERDIKRLLDEANYCNGDSDCTILNTTLGCPFGCHNLGNKNADLTRINALWESYQQSRNTYFGSFCMYSCIAPPEPEEIKCINNKCLDARLEKDIPGSETNEPVFGDDTEINKSCSIDENCRLPGSYAARSDCPYKMRCEDNKCTVVCPWEQ